MRICCQDGPHPSIIAPDIGEAACRMTRCRPLHFQHHLEIDYIHEDFSVTLNHNLQRRRLARVNATGLFGKMQTGRFTVFAPHFGNYSFAPTCGLIRAWASRDH